jgi:hypothetical protein
MNQSPEDPLVRDARREAVAVAVVALAATAYTLGYCTLFGYGRAGEPLRFVLGFPAWVFWGIVAPWCVCVGLCCGFSWWFARDADLGTDAGEREGRADG